MRLLVVMCVALAFGAVATEHEVCMADCLDYAKVFEVECNRSTDLPASNRKKECAQARKLVEKECASECSENRKRDPE
jgi:hypothetical protein